jgi:hypothetical protein
MPGLVPGIHVLAALEKERRGWPGRLARRRASRFCPAMTKKVSATDFIRTGIILDSDDEAKNTPAAPRRAAYSLGKTLLLWAKHFPLN